MRASFLNFLGVALVVMIHPAIAQESREIKFTYEHDKSLFSSEEEMNTMNEQLADLKKADPETYSKLEKNLTEKMQPGVGEALPDVDQMVARRLETQKQLKLMVEENKLPEVKVLPQLPVNNIRIVPGKMRKAKVTFATPVESEEIDESEKVLKPISGETPKIVTEKLPEAVVDFSQKSASPSPVKTAGAASNRNYKPDTCVWAEDIPRKVVVGAGCSKEGSRICIGYVVCEQKVGGGKFTRMSTCSEGLCGDNDSAACTRQGGYGSFKPKADYKESVSQPIDDVLKNSSKAQ